MGPGGRGFESRLHGPLDDADLRALYQQIYAAFRRRRSLLLLSLEHQVRLDELPWVAAIAPLRNAGLGVEARARQTLEQVALLVLASTQWQIFQGFESRVGQQPPAWVERFGPVVEGLRLALEGGRFDADGYGAGRRLAKRFLGWSVGHHWLMPNAPAGEATTQ